MKTRLTAMALSFLACAGIGHGETFVGGGPDPACGGTELKIVRNTNGIVLIEHTVFQSFRSVVERYEPSGTNNWNITIVVYSSHWMQDEPLTQDRITAKCTFRANDTAKASEIMKGLGYSEVDWKKEPERLLEYFQKNQTHFEKVKDG
jgi:hypothetical protein